VNIVRGLRESGKTEFDPTIRGSIMIAKTLATLNTTPSKSVDIFRKICQDILTSETSRIGSKTNQEKVKLIVNELIELNLKSKK
jgi:nitrogenase subunit NifH